MQGIVGWSSNAMRHRRSALYWLRGSKQFAVPQACPWRRIANRSTVLFQQGIPSIWRNIWWRNSNRFGKSLITIRPPVVWRGKGLDGIGWRVFKSELTLVSGNLQPHLLFNHFALLFAGFKIPWDIRSRTILASLGQTTIWIYRKAFIAVWKIQASVVTRAELFQYVSLVCCTDPSETTTWKACFLLITWLTLRHRW
jgi:hypothetical protein